MGSLSRVKSRREDALARHRSSRSWEIKPPRSRLARPLAPGVTRRLVAEFARLRARPAAPSTTLEGLTPREREVLLLVAEGLSNPEIATRLVVGGETVKTHVSRVLTKLGLRDRTQAVVLAFESGLVVPGGRSPRHHRTDPNRVVRSATRP